MNNEKLVNDPTIKFNGPFSGIFSPLFSLLFSATIVSYKNLNECYSLFKESANPRIVTFIFK